MDFSAQLANLQRTAGRAAASSSSSTSSYDGGRDRKRYRDEGVGGDRRGGGRRHRGRYDDRRRGGGGDEIGDETSLRSLVNGLPRYEPKGDVDVLPPLILLLFLRRVRRRGRRRKEETSRSPSIPNDRRPAVRGNMEILAVRGRMRRPKGRPIDHGERPVPRQAPRARLEPLASGKAPGA